MNKLFKTALLTGGVLTAVNGLDNRLETTYYTVKSKRLPQEFDGYKIVHLSDYHNDTIPNLVTEIHEEAPNLIVCTGDMAHDKGSYAPALTLIERICKIAPVLMVNGNHDVWRTDYQKMEKQMTDAGAKFLHNERVFISKDSEKIAVSGIDDPYSCEEKRISTYIKNTMEKLSEYDGFEMLLFHRANLLDDFADYSFDLILSGHMHGGQIRILGFGGFASPRSSYSSHEFLLFPKYFGGRYTSRETVMLVNRGLGNPTIIPRIFNRPEMVVITLRKLI